jgi:hypothetical protein
VTQPLGEGIVERGDQSHTLLFEALTFERERSARTQQRCIAFGITQRDRNILRDVFG